MKALQPIFIEINAVDTYRIVSILLLGHTDIILAFSGYLLKSQISCRRDSWHILRTGVLILHDTYSCFTSYSNHLRRCL